MEEELQQLCVKESGGNKDYYNVTENQRVTANIRLLRCDAGSLHVGKSEGEATAAFR